MTTKSIPSRREFLQRGIILATAMLALFSCSTVFCADQKAPVVLRKGEMPIGTLGAPLGSYLTIEGTRAKKDGEDSANILRVDTVNGKKLAATVDIWIDNIKELPEKGRCVLKGYETLITVGVPPAVVEAAKEQDQDLAMPQRAWSIELFFVPTSVVSPKTLKLRDHDEME